MPKFPKTILHENERHIQVSIRQKYLLEAGSAGTDGLEDYIDALKQRIVKLQAVNNELQRLLSREKSDENV